MPSLFWQVFFVFLCLLGVFGAFGLVLMFPWSFVLLGFGVFGLFGACRVA